MPVTMGCFVVAGLSLIGVPGTVGFISKYYLVVAAFEKGWWWLAFMIVASSLIAVFYVGRVVEVAWFAEDELPENLSRGRTLPHELKLFFEQYHNPNIPTAFD